MAKTRRVNSRIWGDDKFKRLADDEKLLLFYLLTSNQTESTGIWRLSLGLAADDIGWEGTYVEAVFESLLKRVPSMILFDPVESVVFFPNWLRQPYNHPKSPNVVRSWAVLLEDFPETLLLVDWTKRTRFLMSQLGQGWEEAFEEMTAKLSARSEFFRKIWGKMSRKKNTSEGERGGDSDLITGSDPIIGKESTMGESKDLDRSCLEVRSGKNPTTSIQPGPMSGQEIILSGPLSGKVRFTGRAPLWFDWVEMVWVWDSPEIASTTKAKWKARYPSVDADLFLGRIAQWMEDNPARGRRRKNLVSWIGRVWFAPEEERLRNGGRRRGRTTEAGKQMTHDEDDWDGIAQA